MIDLKTTKTYTIADNNTIKNILNDAFKQAIDKFITIESQHTKISKKEYNDVTLILINCQERQLDHYENDIHHELKNQLINLLKLDDNEYVQFGDVKHAYNIGNNCEYPIQIITKDEIINFGRLKSNTDICCNIKHISVADNNGQSLSNKRIELHATHRI